MGIAKLPHTDQTQRDGTAFCWPEYKYWCVQKLATMASSCQWDSCLGLLTNRHLLLSTANSPPWGKLLYAVQILGFCTIGANPSECAHSIGSQPFLLLSFFISLNPIMSPC